MPLYRWRRGLNPRGLRRRVERGGAPFTTLMDNVVMLRREFIQDNSLVARPTSVALCFLSISEFPPHLL